MKSLWHLNSNNSLINLSQAASSEGVRVQAKYSLISAGTEDLVARGMVSNDFMEDMKVPYMEGSFDLPIKYGYSLVGLTAADQPVHVMHPHQDVVHVDAASLFYLDKKLPLLRASLISNMETVINAIWDSNPSTHDRIAICGFGGVGALLAMTLKVHYHITVDVIEVDEWRRAKARSLGLPIGEGAEYDIIYHTSGSPSGLQYCIDHMGHEGKVIELSWYGNKKVELALGKTFHYKRLQIISSQVSSIPKKYKHIHNYQTRKALAASYLMDDRYDALISGVIPFEESPAFFDQLRQGTQGDGLIWVIQYS